MWTKEQLAALRAGASVEDVKAMVSGEVLDPAASSKDGEPEGETNLTGDINLKDVKAVEDLLAEAEASLSAMAEELQTAQAQVEELEKELVDRTESQEKAKADADVLQEQVSQMEPAIMGMIRQRGLVLGAVIPDAYESTEQMLAAYTDLEEKFKAKFKAGRQSMSAKTPTEAKQSKGYDSQTLAEMKAINIPA